MEEILFQLPGRRYVSSQLNRVFPAIKTIVMKLDDLYFLFKGGSGKLGNRVYFQRWGRTNFRSSRSCNVIPNAKQAPVRDHFTAAQAFAKSIIAHPVLKAEYSKRAIPPMNAYTLAVSEYMQQIKNIGTTTAAAEPSYCAPAVMLVEKFKK